MEKQDYFRSALSNFAMDMASGDAIRHLADRGYTARQISRMLDFPTPYERIQKTIWEHYLDKKIILLKEPGSPHCQENSEFVTEYNQSGVRSFRKVNYSQPNTPQEKCDFAKNICWNSHFFQNKEFLSSLLSDLCAKNSEEFSYVTCDFGLRSRREPDTFAQTLAPLDQFQKDYILGIPWERKLAYHRLNSTMRQIIRSLYVKGSYPYPGICYFLKTGEKLYLAPQPDTPPYT